MNNKVAGFTLLVLLCSCKAKLENKEDQIIGSWRLSEVLSFENEDPDMKEVMKIIFKQSLVSKGFVLSFFPDSTYTELTGYNSISGKYEFISDGQVRFGENTLTIENKENIGSNTFLTAIVENPTEDLNAKFKLVNDGVMLTDYKTDPFYGLNNKWRQRPDRKETYEEIRERLLNYILHVAYLLRAANERGDGIVSFAHSQGIIKVYRGGIGRLPKNLIDKSWIHCFYDEEDALKAYNLFSNYLKNGVYKGGTTGNWVKDDSELLLNIFYQIKKKTREEGVLIK